MSNTIQLSPEDEAADLKIIERCDIRVRRRCKVEIKVIRAVIRALTEAGYSLEVDDGDDNTKGTERELIDAVFAVDEATLNVEKEGSKSSFVFFVLGNDGWDVVSDYGVSLDPVLQPVWDWIEEQEAKGE